MIHGYFSSEEAQGLVEYGLILVLIMVVVVVVLTLMGDKISTLYSTLNDGFA